MEVFLSFYAAFGLLALIICLIKGGMRSLPIVLLALLAIVFLPFVLPYIMVAHWNQNNKWGIIIFLICMAISVYILATN